ncbi:MAG: hypothetical protein O2960_23505 [Verrucomicrobia bacterium]|nr:hypothetical protein [Verrucomicrobiota bacterium]
MSLVIYLGFLGMFAGLTGHYWNQLFGREKVKSPLSFGLWVARGIGIPVFFWTVSNLGIFKVLPPLLPDLAMARMGGFPWFIFLCGEISPGIALIGSVWASVTFGWFVVIIYRHAESQREFLLMSLLCSVVCGPFAWLFLHFGGLPISGVAALIWLVPVVHTSLDLLPRKETRPMYSRAIAKMKFGKYSEAEWEMIRQLEKCEDDFEGWMLLADLYATQFKDVPGATQVISDLVEQSNLNSMQISVALHRLADWHLKLREDPVSARTILEDLCRRCPGGHIEKMARLRIERMPATQDDLRQQNTPKPFHLPALNDDFGVPPETAGSPLPKGEAVDRANRCVQRLTQNPDNVAVREEFARLLAEQLGKVETAIEQINLLMEMPGQSDKQKAEWLSLLASWQIRFKHDPEQARTMLNRLIHEFPESPQAFAAQRRISLIEMEERMATMKSKSA